MTRSNNVPAKTTGPAADPILADEDVAQAAAHLLCESRLLVVIGVEDLVIRQVNHLSSSHFADDGDFAPRPLTEVWEFETGVLESIVATVRAGETFAREVLVRSRTSEDMWLVVAASGVGTPVDRIVLAAENVTEAKLRQSELEGKYAAIERSQAVIEFDLTGRVLTANANFLSVMGYRAAEVVGQHHRMFCDPESVETPEYAAFWEQLRAGEFVSGEFRRLGRGNQEVWLQATYNPILDPIGRPTKIVKYAMDVTPAKLRNAEFEGIAAAIDRSQAVIEFDLDGTIRRCNEAFSLVTGYTQEELVGQSHRLLVDPDHARSGAYKAFWQQLARGEFVSGEFKRKGKDGRDVWLQATYNPILDIDGRPLSVVKFAMDVTAAKLLNAEHEAQIAAIDRSQAVIQFDLDGNIRSANELLLTTMGYERDELLGKHHRVLCDPVFAATDDYRAFWKQLAQGDFVSGEFKRISKDGRDVWLHATYSPMLDLEGRPTGVVKFAQDITATKLQNAEFEGRVRAISQAQAVIEFSLDGTIIAANDNLLKILGYRIEELQGRSEAMLCDPTDWNSDSSENFWTRLRRGEPQSAEMKRITSDGREVWLQGTYNPILDLDGRPIKVVVHAVDTTASKVRNVEFESRVNAMDRSQAVIEFDLEGNVLQANENFLRTMGYSAREITGQQHRMFCTDEHLVSPEYRDLWARLRRGEFVSGQFQRVGKYGRLVWLQATYNPILDLNGRPCRVVKYAQDVTDQVEFGVRIGSMASEMNSTVQHLAGSISEIAASTQEVPGLASTTQQNAEEGFDALRSSIEAINVIERQSTEISQIVRVIGELASQTNLLAFNASIEAARAGEHGVGFSVVAGEVRKLAERSSAAAHEISRLIDESVQQIGEGSAVSQRAKEAFEQIVRSVARTNDAIRKIAETTLVQEETSRSVASLIADLATGR